VAIMAGYIRTTGYDRFSNDVERLTGIHPAFWNRAKEEHATPIAPE
jgi:hypothetical protein